MHQPESKRFQCRHIFTDGRRCGSHALRNEHFCYYHHTTRKPVADPKARQARRETFELPLPEDRSAIQAAVGEIIQRIASNDLDPRRAGLLLYALQIASLNLPKERLTAEDEDFLIPPTVDEVIVDPELGPLAPEAEAPPPTRSARIRLIEWRERDVADRSARLKEMERKLPRHGTETTRQPPNRHPTLMLRPRTPTQTQHHPQHQSHRRPRHGSKSLSFSAQKNPRISSQDAPRKSRFPTAMRPNASLGQQ